MRFNEIHTPAAHSHLDAGEFPGPTLNIKYQASEIAPYPELVKILFEPYPKYHLEPTANRDEYLKYLSEVTGLNPGFTGDDVVKAIGRMPEKAVAHTILALSEITEDESHIMPLRDVSPIVDYAHHLYNSGQHPWFDFVVEEDVVKKTATEVNGKKSAPLFRKCDTFIDFLRDVVPVIKEYQEKDPKAFIKIFPQTKNVETFNIGIRHKPDGSTTWIVEWHPGAYTPRAGEDGHSGTVLVKDKAKDKEERIVRTIIEFDNDSHAVAFVKPPKDPRHPDDVPPPLKFPVNQIGLSNMFKPAKIVENHDSMASSNDPLVLLKYIASHSGFQEMLTKFHSLHEKLGYADLVMSGMIGPDTVFGMDIDFGTPVEFASASDYLSHQINANNIHPQPILESFQQLQHAPIFDERDSHSFRIIPHTLSIIRDFIKVSEETKMIWITGLYAVLNLFSDIEYSKAMQIYTVGAYIENWPELTKREIDILKSTNRAYDNFQLPRRKVPVSGKSPYLKNRSPKQINHHKSSEEVVLLRKTSGGRPSIIQTDSVRLTPKQHDAIYAINRVKTSKSPQLFSPKKVSEL